MDKLPTEIVTVCMYLSIDALCGYAYFLYFIVKSDCMCVLK